MAITQYSLSLDKLARYLVEKQNIDGEYKGVNYSHAISIINNVIMFQDIESLFVRMRTYSSGLVDSLIKNKHLVHAPFKEGKLAYVGRDNLYLYSTIYTKDNIQYKNPLTRTVLEYLEEEGSSTRQKIMEKFEISKEDVMDILTELRANFQIYMFYDGTYWTIFSSKLVLEDTKISKASAISELIYAVIKNFGPITVPQIIKILKMSGGRVSTSIIELYENKKIVRGNFIENSSYEAFLASDELEYLSAFLENYKQKISKEIVILPNSDPLAEYWSSADFLNLDEVLEELTLIDGKPICSFEYKIDGDNLHITNLVKTSEFTVLEIEIKNKIQEYAENKGKILIFPELQSEVIENQSKILADILSKRGYQNRTSGLVSFLAAKPITQEESQLFFLRDVFPLLLDLQFLSPKYGFGSKKGVLNGLSSLGIPLPTDSLLVRISSKEVSMLDDLIVDKQLITGKYGAFYRGTISSQDYPYFSKLSPSRQYGVLEENVLHLINQKERINFSQLKSSLNYSTKVLLSALQRLELANKIIQTKSISKQIVWELTSKFLANHPVKTIQTQREAWLEVLYRIFSTNLPLSIRQLANLTGLSNTQLEVYLKELIASKGVRSGRFFEDENEVQFTIGEIENKIIGYIYKKEEDSDSGEVIVTYLPKNEPLLILYRNYLLKRFRLKSLFSRSSPTEYGEIILMNGEPIAALHLKKADKIEYINNIEILPEFTDSHTLMLIFSSIQEYLLKTKDEKDRVMRIKQINGITLNTEGGKKYIELLNNMQIKYQIL